MDHDETLVDCWERWWWWKKNSVLHWWRRQKTSVSEFPRCLRRYKKHRKITLSALTETDKAKSAIPVVKQRLYTGRGVITSSLANTPCAALGVGGVLEKLNTTLGKSYASDSVNSVLDSYVAQNYDFGTVYAYFRYNWDVYDITINEYKLRIREEDDKEMRRKVLVHDRITRREVAPRRVWDLHANRVVPYWVVDGGPWVWGISHAWVDKKERMDVMTPINGYQWPVPMPKDANLDLIRIEMLNHGVEYAWLDVLCLRQEGGKREDLRLEEWKLDVPTIGWVYCDVNVVCYFNGLGRPQHLTPDYFMSDRCWFRRAWTLQEITNDAIIGGDTRKDIMEKEVQKKFDEELTHLRNMRKWSLAIVLTLQMQTRVSTKPLDKVAGLTYSLYTTSIPIYDPEMSDVDAWEVLMDCMSPESRAEFFFYYPEPGNGNKYWRPSWQQIMTFKHFVPYLSFGPGPVEQTEDTGTDWYEGFCIDSAHVQGLDEGLEGGKPQCGEMVFKNAAGLPCTFKIFADHGYPIPDGSYALIGSYRENTMHYDFSFCVVGWLREDGRFKKLILGNLDLKRLKLFFVELQKQTTNRVGLRTVTVLYGGTASVYGICTEAVKLLTMVYFMCLHVQHILQLELKLVG
ncbi:hypothetical protein ARMSODRAFT_1008301 [Armillaria solidipes]|uniref:Heterokaryon incompatibility domain-containing protein n=1 Tax=Armillaria solidipes TaxID=1076256 RepID=A0A2H3B5P2_9AGAR|nr:hypothetical protein ARMSODRAFT_1008301 [Armillaria solidipes]